MKRRMQLIAVWLGLLAAATYAQTQQESSAKWSRQLESVATGDSDALDWVPLAQPLDDSGKDRSGNGRVLTYSQSFPPSARFGDLGKPTGGQFDFPYQFQRFSNGGPQALPLRHQGPPPLKSSAGQEPTSQSFFKFEMPFHNEANQPNAPPTLQTGYQIQHSFGGGGGLPAPSSLFSPPALFGQQQQQQFPDFQALPQKPLAQALSKPLHQQNYIQDNFSIKSHGKPLPTQASLQSVTPQVFPVDPEPESVFGLNKQAAPSSASSANNQQQEVQLLYVPYDTLYNQQRQPQGSSSLGSSSFEVNKFNVNAGLPAVNPYQINQFYTQDPSVGSDFFGSGTTARPSSTTSQPQHIFQSFAQPQAQAQAQSQPQFTTAKPKPKAHQPPLAMFLLRPNARPTQSDVVAALRNARAISVIDAPTKQTPDIFVGPAGMPIPDGYVKFDLPYLSQLAHSRDLQDVSFFVAPLSYRTPNGFNKILLPEPHVGSIVINRAKDSAAIQELVQPQHVRTQRPYTTTSSTRNPFETSTQPQRAAASPAPTRGNKFSYYYVQDGIQEVSSPKQPAKQERHKKKRPQHAPVEQPVYRAPAKTPNPFDTLNQIGGEDFFNTLSSKPSTSTTSSTSTSTSTTSTTSTTAPPQTLFTYGSRPQVEFPSSNGQLYPQFDTAPQLQPVQEQLPRLTTRPPTATTAEEELRMKQYFRQQDAFRQRPQTTNPPFEQVQYTPTTLDYDVPQPTTTQKTKQRVNIYTPGAVPVTTSDVGYNVDPQGQPPLNHRPSYNQNEVIDSGNVEYEPNPYHVPSELPALTPDIPGLVNNLQEKDKLAATTTPLSEPEPETRPTRRPLLRTRKPAISKVVTTSSVSYSESETNAKLPTHRIRRPYGSRGTSAAATGSTDNGEEVNSTTRRPASSRNPLLRNPNRIRYQPTTEERQTLKTKKKHYKGSKNGKPSEDQDLEYQRDVLKQNYPVFKAPSRRPTSPTAIPSSYDVGNTEGPASESQQVYTVTPSNSIDQGDQGVYVPSLLEPMQIAQHYNEFSKDNYGPGYFPNQEDLNPTEAIVRNEVSPIFTTLATTTPSTTSTTTTTTTTEAPVTTTTRRSPFIRRNYPRVRTTTTTEPSVTTTTPSEERPSIRSRLPPRRVVKVRQRQRRPAHPASSTAAPEEEVEQVTQRQNLRKLSRYNQEQSEREAPQAPPRRRYKQPFQLEGQESQWSPASETGNSNTNSNSFKPLNPKYGSKNEAHNFENEPEIVTAGPTDQPETYEFNVAANLGGSGAAQRTTPALKAPNLKPEKSFAELLEEVMGKAPEELATETPTSSTIGRLNRRGKWKKSRVSGGSDNGENFETAESQNLGPQLYNSLYAGSEKKEEPELKTTTPMTPATEAPTTTTSEVVTTTAAAITTPEEYEVTTAKSSDATTIATTLAMSEESATRRMDTAADVDDLETQPSIFSEVRQQLHDLFAIDESEDQAVTAALAAVGKRRQAYTSIKRTKPATPAESSTLAATEAPAEVLDTTTVATPANGKEDNFHKDLMEHVVYATSTSTKVTSETEICYRGRCIRSEDLPANHKLH
ncbi:mucin-2 [Drosophila montana]|uniref:mucin-2 n=1 Tax=Drosophila montana TaxID=40370 RepID=UPI00313E9B9F